MPNDHFTALTVFGDGQGNAVLLNPETNMPAVHLGSNFLGHDFAPLFQELQAANDLSDEIPCFQDMSGRFFVDAVFLIKLCATSNERTTGKCIAEFVAHCMRWLLDAESTPPGLN